MPEDIHPQLNALVRFAHASVDGQAPHCAPEASAGEKLDAIEAALTDLRSQVDRLKREAGTGDPHTEHQDLVGAFSASLAHELRAPLQTILSATELIQILQDTPQVTELTQTIESQVFRAHRLIDNTRALTRRPVHLKPTDLSQAMTASMDTSRTLLDVRNIHIEILELTSLSPVLADVEHLRQVILNLVTNAVDALHARAKLDPNARQHLQVRGTQDTDEVCLEIMDSGSGIPTEIQARIFDPFFSTRRGSLGIGLSITKRLVEAQGGTLSVESGDQGSTFRVTLRRA